jgi:hypothetical protein
MLVCNTGHSYVVLVFLVSLFGVALLTLMMMDSPEDLTAESLTEGMHFKPGGVQQRVKMREDVFNSGSQNFVSPNNSADTLERVGDAKFPDSVKRNPVSQRGGSSSTLARLTIAMASDEDMIPYVPTLLHSIHWNNPGDLIDIFFISSNASDVSKEVLRLYVERHFPLIKLTFKDYVTPLNYQSPLKHVSAATMSRLGLPSLFPDLKRVIYLDVDVLVLDSLRPLMEVELTSTGVAARSSLEPNVINTWLKKTNVRLCHV